jgi:hypothetical protein
MHETFEVFLERPGVGGVEGILRSNEGKNGVLREVGEGPGRWEEGGLGQ